MRRLAVAYGLYEDAIPFEADCGYGMQLMFTHCNDVVMSSLLAGHYYDPSFFISAPKVRFSNKLLLENNVWFGIWDLNYGSASWQQHILYLRYANPTN
jgi:hypothetical protein